MEFLLWQCKSSNTGYLSSGKLDFECLDSLPSIACSEDESELTNCGQNLVDSNALILTSNVSLSV